MSNLGPAYDESRDGKRVNTQMGRVRDFMLANTSEEKLLSVPEIAKALEAIYGYHFPENSVQAQIRNLAKSENGSYRRIRRYVGGGLHKWALLPPRPVPQQRSLFEGGDAIA